MSMTFLRISICVVLFVVTSTCAEAFAYDVAKAKGSATEPAAPVDLAPAGQSPATAVLAEPAPTARVMPHGYRSALTDRPPAPVRPPRGYWQPGGYEARVGSPYYYSAGPYPTDDRYAAGYHQHTYVSPNAATGYGYPSTTWTDPYSVHFGPGYYRHGEYGHYRFPYYSYRRPWYFPGHPVYNRDTNFVW